ncbi:MAG: ABC transporter permease, partial [Nitrososphaerota archaeon]
MAKEMKNFARKNGKKLIISLANSYIYIILLFFWIVSCAASPFFRTASTFSNILISAVPIALISLGQTIAVISGGFDLSVGAMASMATCIASATMQLGIIPSIIAVLVIALFIGFINGIGIAVLNIDSFIMTLGMMFILDGINLLVRPVPGGYVPEGLKGFFLFKIGDFPLIAFFILFLAGIIGYIILQKKHIGRAIYAVGGNLRSAWFAGINPVSTKIKVYMMSAFFAALAGIFIMTRISSGNANAGDPYLFDSFITVFMGGTLVTGGIGGYGGTLAASLIIASLGSILQFLGISIWY